MRELASDAPFATAFRLSNTSGRPRIGRCRLSWSGGSDARMVARGRGVPQQVPEEFRRFFDQFGFGTPEDMEQVPQQGTGSGFILDETGHIMTNHHVVKGATRITVRTLEGREYEARLIGSDSATDVAIIKIEKRNGERLPVSRSAIPMRCGWATGCWHWATRSASTSR
jgi:S1-C subfamily serine protease